MMNANPPFGEFVSPYPRQKDIDGVNIMTSPVGIEDAIFIYLNTTLYNLNQQYAGTTTRTFIDNFPYGHFITEWYNWKITASSTNGDILVYDSPSGDIFIPALPSGYTWNTDECGNIIATISTSGMDNSGHVHHASTQITLRNILVIMGFSQSPIPIYKGFTGTVMCTVTPGSGNPIYFWSLLNPKPGLSLSSNGSSTASITYSATEMLSSNKKISADDIVIPQPMVRCTVNNGTAFYTSDFTLFLADQPSGGCPFVYSWNGEDWMEDNNILPQSQDSTVLGQDVTDFYQLFTSPQLEHEKYYLAVGEFEHEKSYLDQLKLLVVDHPQETFITVSDEGQIIQFAKPAYFASAELDSVDVYKKLYQLDEEKVAAQREETMRLSFEEAAGSEEKWLLLIGQVSAHSAKERYAGSIIDKNKESFTSFRLRKNPSYQWVLVPQGNTSTLQVEILWKEESLVDYTELSRKLELPFTVYTPELINAEHNVIGDVRSQLLLIDEDRVELNPNEWITLEYSAPPINEGMERSFVFVSRGRYETLPDTTLIEGKKQIPPMKKSSISSVNTSANEVIEYKLSQNYPNPFNPVTTIHYSVKEPGFVSLILYDLLGREAATLVSENKIEGNYTINFDASNLSSGIYVCRIKVNKYSSLMKMVVLK